MVALAKAGPPQFQPRPMEPVQHPPSATQRISCRERLANLLLQHRTFSSSFNLNAACGLKSTCLLASTRVTFKLPSAHLKWSTKNQLYFSVKIRLSHYWLLLGRQTKLTYYYLKARNETSSTGRHTFFSVRAINRINLGWNFIQACPVPNKTALPVGRIATQHPQMHWVQHMSETKNMPSRHLQQNWSAESRVSVISKAMFRAVDSDTLMASMHTM